MFFRNVYSLFDIQDNQIPFSGEGFLSLELKSIIVSNGNINELISFLKNGQSIGF